MVFWNNSSHCTCITSMLLSSSTLIILSLQLPSLSFGDHSEWCDCRQITYLLLYCDCNCCCVCYITKLVTAQLYVFCTLVMLSTQWFPRPFYLVTHLSLRNFQSSRFPILSRLPYILITLDFLWAKSWVLAATIESYLCGALLVKSYL